ncbi:DUF397 domain-containing protein [Actinorugispora endophytica]|uniref:Uncharacterized protein DUF397 n=1 Tax=Actinorugispora endophytica TaxID=1605990 RepID=A0A4R6V196_9ACTN|nr:DUF397 domain-containing protein [Actinorugispora endophytica]TDQ53761.1 uncharacterized protein DUF397 [Actinorugispora endophytica]
MSDQQTWRKSSYSGANNYCVEVAELPGAAAVRDSKHPQVGQLSFAASEWRAFLAALKGREV